jgi:hypothetical protein
MSCAILPVAAAIATGQGRSKLKLDRWSINNEHGKDSRLIVLRSYEGSSPCETSVTKGGMWYKSKIAWSDEASEGRFYRLWWYVYDYIVDFFEHKVQAEEVVIRLKTSN